MFLQTGNGVGEKIYEGAVTYGRIKTTIMLIIGIIVGFALLVFGFKLRNTKDVHSGNVQATISNADCKQSTTVQKNTVINSINCILKIKYTVDGKDYDNTINTSGQTYSQNQTLAIRYDPSNPYNITMNPTNKTLGSILIGISLFMILGSFITWLIAQKSTFGAALVAGSDTVDIFRGN
jgi:hypothetical protein